jgi:hypothetical protein
MKWCRKNIVHPDRPHMLLREPHHVGYKHTLIICNTYCFSAVSMVTQTRLSVTFTHILSDLLKLTNYLFVEPYIPVALIVHCTNVFKIATCQPNVNNFFAFFSYFYQYIFIALYVLLYTQVI